MPAELGPFAWLLVTVGVVAAAVVAGKLPVRAPVPVRVDRRRQPRRPDDRP